MRGAGVADVRLIFVLYLLVIAAGIVVAFLIGFSLR